MKQLYKAKSALLLLLVLNTYSYAQTATPEIPTKLPEIIPPSPTVAALMKFEEVPVSHYTGIPDISIPLYSTTTRSRDIAIHVSLKYHPGGIQVDNTASWAGMGWSLMAGGTISRTVKGFPDDIPGGTGKIGMYSGNNPYEDVFFGTGSFVLNNGTYQRYKYGWEALETGEYDTEYDIYQFNFMGYTGRFYVNKTGQVVKLFNDSAMKIIYNGSSFTIYDDKGYTYVFSAKESTFHFKEVTNQYPGGLPQTPLQSQLPAFTSAYHLTGIYDRNNQPLALFDYTPVTESVISRTTTTNYRDTWDSAGMENQCPGYTQQLLPWQVGTLSIDDITTQKLSLVTIMGKGKISFEKDTAARPDLDAGGARLKGIKVMTLGNEVVKEYVLEHDHLGAGQRLVLTGVVEKSTSGTAETLEYSLEYNSPESLPVRLGPKKDWWGYFNNSSFSKETNPDYCTTGILQKLVLPTGGAIVFNFGANQYSYQGDMALSEFHNDSNVVVTDVSESYSGSASVNADTFRYFNLKTQQEIGFNIITSGYTSLNKSQKKIYYFELIPVMAQSGPFELAFVSSYTQDNSRLTKYLKLEDIDPTLTPNSFNTSLVLSGAYVIRFRQAPTLPTTIGTYTLNFDYNRFTNTYKYVDGGGLRINNIGYFTDGAISKDYYGNLKNEVIPPAIPDREKKYNYNFFTDQNRSSGSLAFAKPVFEYGFNREHYLICGMGDMLYEVHYDVTTEFNNLSPFKTQGADVGYKNVTVTDNRRSVSESTTPMGSTLYTGVDNADLGRTEYTYTSPIDYPAQHYSLSYPFLNQDYDMDYKRGLLQKQSQYNNQDKLVLETIFEPYDITEGSEITGVRFGSSQNCPYAKLYSEFEGYYDCATDPGCGLHCGYPPTYVGGGEIKEYFGWARLPGKTTTEYFYTSADALQGTIVTKETYTYNSVNKKLASKAVQTGTTAETLTEAYTYYTDAASNRYAEIQEIETKRNGTLIDSKKINYSNTTGASMYLPSTIATAKGVLSLEDRIQFVKYDGYGNILEAKTEGGTPVLYIWGYNHTATIAMIQNLTYANLPGSLATAAQNASNGTNEATLLTALNNLRASLASSHPNAVIATYTYKPMVGVSTITDAKGDRTSFFYDGFGRLEMAKDKDGNILSEHQYHYKQ